MFEISKQGNITFRDIIYALKNGKLEFYAFIEKIPTKPKYYNFGKHLEELMDEKNINRPALAGIMRRKKSTIDSYCNGYRLPSRINLVKLSKIFGRDSHYLEKYLESML